MVETLEEWFPLIYFTLENLLNYKIIESHAFFWIYPVFVLVQSSLEKRAQKYAFNCVVYKLYSIKLLETDNKKMYVWTHGFLNFLSVNFLRCGIKERESYTL